MRVSCFVFLLVFLQVSVAFADDASAVNGDQTLTTPHTKTVKWRFLAELEVNSPVIGALAGGDRLMNTRAFQLRLGGFKKRVSVFAFFERGHFEEPSYDDDVTNDLFSFGAGGAFGYFKNRMNTMLLLGTTVLLDDSFQNERGTMGFYSEIRPAGFEIPLGDFHLLIYPITLSWLIPVLQNIPLFYVHYRTAVSIGGRF